MKTGVVLEQLFRQREFTVDSISVTAFASPEGSAAMNLDLSRRQAQALGNYLKERFPMRGSTRWWRYAPQARTGHGRRWCTATV
ncbi:MAG: hypothetical protein ACLR8Y_10815 [Alistipes indistinctus]